MTAHPAPTQEAARAHGVLAQIAALRKMDRDALDTQWELLMAGVTPPPSREAIRQRLIYRVQEIAYGGIRRDARERLESVARGGPNRVPDKRPQAGTVFRREWHGQLYEVKAVDGGFEWNGRKYRSLTAVAKAITGQHWSGNLFFGIAQRKGKSK